MSFWCTNTEVSLFPVKGHQGTTPRLTDSKKQLPPLFGKTLKGVDSTAPDPEEDVRVQQDRVHDVKTNLLPEQNKKDQSRLYLTQYL